MSLGLAELLMHENSQINVRLPTTMSDTEIVTGRGAAGVLFLHLRNEGEREFDKGK